MQAYKMMATVQRRQRLVLENLPFAEGERVEAVVWASEESRQPLLADLKALFAETQALPQLETITEDEIAAEIAAYRTTL
jgi:hypothetical protein